jgi:hypothetical protein
MRRMMINLSDLPEWMHDVMDAGMTEEELHLQDKKKKFV